ncbi:MAG: KUP/HAK/KT family potassium transporter [Sphingobacteriales bacterium]|nr:KUP/HAK/KT family potassium transporter [Sphingobacteriales bacterium]
MYYGAEALYADLGHCGKRNIQASWIFVLSCLILNYLGQSAWCLQHEGEILTIGSPFYAIVPKHLLTYFIILATIATIIASQALISGCFTLVSEAIKQRSVGQFTGRLSRRIQRTDLYSGYQLVALYRVHYYHNFIQRIQQYGSRLALPSPSI